MTFVKTHNPLSKSFDGLLNELFNELPSTLGKTMREDVFANPATNIVETATNYAVQLSVPGFVKSDFSVKLDGTILTISAEKKEEVKNETDKTIKKEFSVKSFKRSFNIDDKIDATNITAKYENGILTIELSKKEVIKNEAKEIAIL